MSDTNELPKAEEAPIPLPPVDPYMVRQCLGDLVWSLAMRSTVHDVKPCL